MHVHRFCFFCAGPLVPLAVRGFFFCLELLLAADTAAAGDDFLLFEPFDVADCFDLLDVAATILFFEGDEDFFPFLSFAFSFDFAKAALAFAS